MQSLIITATLLVDVGNISSLEGHNNNCSLTVSLVLFEVVRQEYLLLNYCLLCVHIQLFFKVLYKFGSCSSVDAQI